MHPEISSRFDALEVRRENLVERVKALPGSHQILRPDTHSYSPVEVIEHMMLSERYGLSYLKKAPPATLKSRTVKHGPLYKKSLAMMRDTTRSSPTIPQMKPHPPVHLLESERNWEHVRRDIRIYLAQCESPTSPFVRYHFLFGILSAFDYLELLEVHTNYHEVRFPGS